MNLRRAELGLRLRHEIIVLHFLVVEIVDAVFRPAFSFSLCEASSVPTVLCCVGSSACRLQPGTTKDRFCVTADAVDHRRVPL